MFRAGLQGFLCHLSDRLLKLEHRRARLPQQSTLTTLSFQILLLRKRPFSERQDLRNAQQRKIRAQTPEGKGRSTREAACGRKLGSGSRAVDERMGCDRISKAILGGTSPGGI